MDAAEAQTASSPATSLVAEDAGHHRLPGRMTGRHLMMISFSGGDGDRARPGSR